MAVPLYVISITILVLLSAFFSATETAFSSISKLRLKSLETSSSRNSKIVVKLCNNYDYFISTVLIGNNIVNIGASTLSTLLFAVLITNPALAPTVSTIVMTLVVLIFGEITPKTIAKRSPEFFAHLFAPVIIVVYYLLYPLTWVFAGWQKIIGKIFKKRDKDVITDEELITMVGEAETEGGLNEYESHLICSAIKFDDLTVKDILTPRVDVVAVDLVDSPDEILRTFVDTGYSRLPVYDDNIDNIVGILSEKDFYRSYIGAKTKGESVDVASIMDRDVIFASNRMKISALLRLIQERKSHIAIIADEFGGTLGIVTLEDILEELVGDIWDEHDEVEEDFQHIEDDRYIVRGDTGLDDFYEYFGSDRAVEDGDPVTLSGLIVTMLGRVASPGDVVDIDNLTITVKSMIHHKVDSVEVIKNSDNIENIEK